MAETHISRSGHQIICSQVQFERWNDLPYGIWTCADGREVLFNRFYEPLRQRMPGQPATNADPKEFIRFAKQRWFYNDATVPERAKRAAALAAIQAWEAA